MIGDLRVLVVDDQESMRMLVVSALKSMGVELISVASDGEQAIQIIRQGMTHLVLLDVEMPRLNGFDTLTRIREDPNTKDQPVIMMTGRSDMDMVLKIMTLKVDSYLVKPISSAKLQAAVNAFLAKRQAKG